MDQALLQQLVDELTTTVTESRPGHEAVWEHRGIQVTVYGQARYAMSKPTPWAVVKVAGHQKAYRTWEQIVLAADELAGPQPE